MKLPRVIFFPLLLAFVLLFAQQAGAAHALRHALENSAQHQEDKRAPHSNTCEKCAHYVQLGSALNAGAHGLTLLDVSSETTQLHISTFRPTHTLAAAARGPPQLQPQPQPIKIIA